MALILELLVVWAIVFVIAGAFQAYRGRGLAKGAHYAAIFGLFIVLVYFVLAVVTDLADLRP